MNLDPRTAVVLFSASALVLAALAFFSFRRRLTPCIRLWLASLLLQTVIWALVALRGQMPDWAATTLPFCLLSLHYAMLLAAIALFYGLPLRRYWPYWPVPPVVGALIWFGGDAGAAQMAGGVGFAVQIAMLAALLLTRQDAWPGLRRIMGGTALAGAALLLARIGMQFADPTLPRELLTPSPEQGRMFLLGFVFRMVFAFGFLLLIEAQRYEELRALAARDPLTGAHNRRSFFELAERELARQRRSGEPLTLLIIDLDHFKQVNDDHGHLAGDQVLRDVNAAIAGLLRQQDILGRYGGEEFCVLAPDTDAAGAATLAERLRAGIAALAIAIDGVRARPVTASIGFACLADDASVGDIDELLARADAALYEAKRAGRNRVVAASASGDAAQRYAQAAA